MLSWCHDCLNKLPSIMKFVVLFFIYVINLKKKVKLLKMHIMITRNRLSSNLDIVEGMDAGFD